MALTHDGEITYPADLPITARRPELLTSIRENQVIIVAGETGSGKSTQIPKMCLELGLAEHGWIGHTQPRRIAARAIAERVAEELDSLVGDRVGYKVRFTDKVSTTTAIKQMTDGVLLAEMQRDRRLSAYSTIIIDEAHERSLNIDFLLGYLKQLLPPRPDLKLIVTSATIDTDRFSAHFDDAPIIEVSGRTYPVDIRYRPLDGLGGDPLTQPEAICDALREVESSGPGDVLVFCSGEREIREAADAISETRFRNTEVLPLFGRLSAAEQHRVFDAPKNRSNADRRVVLATNVAETSITVPGIRFVVDPGTARISRYSRRTKVQRLPIEDISQASAQQRSGRCGRIGPGICIRLYSEESFEARPEFTEPEITRTNLASVILQMASLGLGDVEQFPFVDPPEVRNIRDGVALLEELAAVDPDAAGTKRWLTPVGRQLARLPVDPRFGRMLIAAADAGCLDEVIVITAALSVRDPRERPAESQQKAAESHARFAVSGSDFLPWLRLWEYLQTERKARSGNQFRKMCRSEYLNTNRVREWQDIVRQLQSTARSLRWTTNSSPADPDIVHQAMLTGLLSHVGRRDADGNEFTGGRSARFLIGRGSALTRKPPDLVMVGELIETNRLWAHSAARIQSEWAEVAGDHLLKRSYDDPDWDAEKGSAMTTERISLYGVTLVAGRRVHYRRVDPEVARELFIHHALIEGDWQTHHGFFAQNESVLNEVRRLGARQRRDLFVEYDVLFAFYDERLEASVSSGADFDGWWNRERLENPGHLDLVLEDIFDVDRHEAEANPVDSPQPGDVELKLDYEFAAGAADDGVTVTVPVSLLDHVKPEDFASSVPGKRADVVTALIRSMPKADRKSFVPVPDTVAAIMPTLTGASAEADLVGSVRRALGELRGRPISPEALSIDRLPEHLRPRFRVVDGDGNTLAAGRDLDALRSTLAEEVRRGLAAGAHDLVVSDQTSWTFGEIDRTVDTTTVGQRIEAYPALVDEGDTVGLQLFAHADEQYEQMWFGQRRLLRLNVGGSARALNSLLDSDALLAIASGPHGSKLAWVNDAADCAFALLLADGGGPVWDESAWQVLLDNARDNLRSAVETVGQRAIKILLLAAELRAALSELTTPTLTAARTDMQAHVDRLIYPGHLAGVGPERLADVLRYLQGIRHRLDKLPDRVAQDATLMARCRSIESEFELHANTTLRRREYEELNWLLEEFRVATFAQHIGAKGKVSEKRIRKALAAL